MAETTYRRHRFPATTIQHAVWLYLRFTLSYRDVEELLAERGLDIPYETVRCWVLKFGHGWLIEGHPVGLARATNSTGGGFMRDVTQWGITRRR